MIVMTGQEKVGNNYITSYDALSTDDKDALIAELDITHVGSSLMCVDTGAYYKLNMDSTNTNLKWYSM
jgi:hypothetical protein